MKIPLIFFCTGVYFKPIKDEKKKERMNKLLALLLLATTLQCTAMQEDLIMKAVIWSGMLMLKRLKAQRACFRKLGDTIGNLHRLESVDFSHNSMGEINSMIFLHATLRSFNFAHNGIVRLSAEISNYYRLEELCLDDNLLEELPTQLGGMKTLVLLSIRNNRLSGIPDSCTALTALRILRLAGNRVPIRPAWVATLPALEEQDLDFAEPKRVEPRAKHSRFKQEKE